MTLEIGFLFAVLAVMAYFFFTEKLPVELTAFIGLLVLIIFGYVDQVQAFEGFAEPVVITMLSIFFLSAALLHTGIADRVGSKAELLLGNREVPIIIAIMLVSGILSAFINNIAAAAVLLPAVGSVSRRTGISPARLFMPLSFGSILGGTTTLVGTPPNMLASSILEDNAMVGFDLFEFAPIGMVFLLCGTLYMTTIGRRLLPDRGRSAESAAGAATGDLVQVYHLQETFFSIRLPRDSILDGSTLRSSRLGSTLGIQVVSIQRAGTKERVTPQPDTVLRGGDELIVHGSASDLERLFRMQGVEMAEVAPGDIARSVARARLMEARVREEAGWCGQSIRNLAMRERFGVLVVGLVRQGESVRDFASQPLRAGDRVVMLGVQESARRDEIDEQCDVIEITRNTLKALRGYLFLLRVPADSELAGTALSESRMGQVLGITVSGILRGDQVIPAVDPSETIQEHDELIVLGEPERVRDLLAVGKVELDRESADAASMRDLGLETEDVGIVEATLSPRSRAAGKTLAEIGFRDRHGLQVLSIWRDGNPMHIGLGNIKLMLGDALLLQGPWKRLRLLGSHPDFVVLSLRAQEERRLDKAPQALGALVLMIGLVVGGVLPIHVAAFAAAILVVLLGAITMEEAYRAVEWRAIFLVAAVLPVGNAMRDTGAADLVSDALTSFAAPVGIYAVFACLVLLSSMLSQCLDGAPAVVILAPVVLATAEQMGVSARPLMMGVGVAASAAFMTPFSHKANLLVMGAGGYRVSDYLRVGTPLTIVLLIILVLLAPALFPF